MCDDFLCSSPQFLVCCEWLIWQAQLEQLKTDLRSRPVIKLRIAYQRLKCCDQVRLTKLHLGHCKPFAVRCLKSHVSPCARFAALRRSAILLVPAYWIMHEKLVLIATMSRQETVGLSTNGHLMALSIRILRWGASNSLIKEVGGVSSLSQKGHINLSEGAFWKHYATSPIGIGMLLHKLLERQ